MNYAIIGRILPHLHPDLFRELQDKYLPVLEVPEHISKIYRYIIENYPDLDKADTNILFAAAVYTLYSPASLIGQGIQRAPNYIRQEMCAVLNYPNREMVNYWQDIARAYIKNPAFNRKVKAIVDAFRPYGEAFSRLADS